MRAYEEYKQIDLPWLKQIPAHWKVFRAKALFSVINERSSDGKEELLSVSSNKGVVKREDANVTMFQAESYEGYKLCWPNDLAVNSLWAWQYGLGFSEFHGIISTAYSVYRLKTDSHNPKYLNYLVRGADFHWELRTRSKGIWKSRYILSDEDFLDSPIISPPREEQDAIVRFLDAKCEKIDKLIKLKERQIVLLNEKKQNIINQAVTKGLDPNAPMKDSGVDWIGEIPEGWRIVALKYISNFVKTGGTPSGASQEFYSEKGFNWFTPGDFNEDICLGQSTRQLSKKGIKEVTVFPKNTVHFIGIGATLGKVSLAEEESSCNQQINAISCNEKYNPEFLVYFLRAIREHVFKTAQYTTMPILNQEKTKQIQVPLLTLEDQNLIIDFIKRTTSVVDNAVLSARQEIILLNEYKKRVISDVVTGKINILEA